MADSKISQLSSASLPLAGTEVLPIVQTGTTVKVATNDLTVRNLRANATTGIVQVTGPTAGTTRVMTVPDANFTAARTDVGQTFSGNQVLSSTSAPVSLRLQSAAPYGFPGDFTMQTGGFGTPSLGVFDNTAGAYRSVIDGSGYTLLGYNSSNGAFRLQVNGQIFATSSTIATSDGQYKENVTPLTGSLDLVMALRPVQFNWKNHPVHSFDPSTPTIGFIAQEVQSTLADTPYLNSIVKRSKCAIEPEVVDPLTGEVTKPAVTEDFLGIAEGNLISLLTNAIQELKQEFDAYKASHP
jgi:hypothetical protein